MSYLENRPGLVVGFLVLLFVSVWCASTVKRYQESTRPRIEVIYDSESDSMTYTRNAQGLKITTPDKEKFDSVSRFLEKTMRGETQ